MVEVDARDDAAKKMSKSVSVKMPNVRGDTAHALSFALEPDETTIKVSIAGSAGCEVYVRASDLMKALRLFEAAVSD